MRHKSLNRIHSISVLRPGCTVSQYVAKVGGRLPRERLSHMHEFALVSLTELQVDIVWNQTQMQSFFGVGHIPVYVHQPFTNPPVAIEALSMLQDSLIEASVTQVQN